MLSLLIGDISPTDGTIKIANVDIFNKKYMGVLYDNIRLYDILTVHETIKLFCVFNQVNHKDIITQYYSLFSIDKISSSLIKELSAGEKQRVCLLLSIIRPVKLLFLDEPFANIDPIMADNLWSKISTKDRTIIFSSHNWNEMKNMDIKIAFMHSGRIINAPKSIEQIYKELPSRMILSFENFNTLPDVEKFKLYKHGNNVNLFYDKLSDSNDICSLLTQQGVNFTFRKAEIRDAYLYRVYLYDLLNN